MLEAQIEQLDSFRKYRAQVMQHAGHFARDVGPLLPDFTGAPQALQRRFHTALEDGQLYFGEMAVVALDQQQVERTVMLQHGRALGFGRVRRQHGLGRNAAHGVADFFLTESTLTEIVQIPQPETGLAFATPRIIGAPPDLIRGVLFHHVQKLKHDRQRLAVARGVFRSCRRPLRRGACRPGRAAEARFDKGG